MSLLLALTGGTTNYTLSGAAGSYSVTGVVATVTRSFRLVCESGSYVYAGVAAGVTYTPVAGAYVITANAGAYSVTGAAATIAISGGQQTPSNEVVLKPWYIRRNKKILLFKTAQEVDSYIAAEQAANEAIEKAQKTSRRARKRLKDKIYPAADSIDLIEIEQLIVRFDVAYALPNTFNDDDYFELLRITELLKQMQDEEEIELLLIA